MKIIYFLLTVLAIQPLLVQAQKIDSLITPTDTLIFIKQPVIKLSKPEALVKQATEKQFRSAEAIALFKKAITEKTKAQDSNWVADIHFAMAKLHFKTNDDKSGFLELLTAQSLYSQSKNASCQAAITEEIAGIYEKNKDWAEAEKYYLLALKQKEVANLVHEVPYTELALAKGYHKQKEYKKAVMYLSSSINQFELDAEKNKRGEAYLLLADIQLKQKGLLQTENLILKRALPFYSGVGLPKGKIACFDMLGTIYQQLKRYSEAKWFYLQANTLSRATGDINGVISSLVNLGKVKTNIGEYKSAMKDFKEAETLAKKKNSVALLADVKNGYAFYNKVKSAKESSKTSKLATTTTPVTKKVIAENLPKTAVKTGQL